MLHLIYPTFCCRHPVPNIAESVESNFDCESAGKACGQTYAVSILRYFQTLLQIKHRNPSEFCLKWLKVRGTYSLVWSNFIVLVAEFVDLVSEV
jgi:hypothetical protein